MGAFVEKTLGQGKTPVLVAAALGEAQDVVRYLGGRHVLRLHPTAFRACEVYVAQGVPSQGFVPLGGEGDVVVVPPTARLSRLGLGEHRVCTLSGRAVDGIASADEALPLADHAGFEDLLDCAVRSGARRVYTIDGYAEELARQLRNRGIDQLPSASSTSFPCPEFKRRPDFAPASLESVDSTPRGLAA